MSKLIVCLGYHLPQDNSIPVILENRLKNVARLCIENPDSTLLLMGSSPYGESGKNKASEASVMKEYLEINFEKNLTYVKIITEETTTSTVEQLCYLKSFLQAQKLNSSDLFIVSSEFFSERVKLYAEYIFGIIDGIIFIESAVPPEARERFKELENEKIKEGIKWLAHIKKGDDATILREQQEFQRKVVVGEIKQPTRS